MHKRCSGIQGNIPNVTDLKYQWCQSFMDKNMERITVDGDDIKILEMFSYLGDVLSTEGYMKP